MKSYHLGAVAVLSVGLGTGGYAIANEWHPSPVQTISYVAEKYQTGNFRPDLTFRLSYDAPVLRLQWQDAFFDTHTDGEIINNMAAEIDLRYASFDIWSDGDIRKNTIIVECANEFPCYRDLMRNRYYQNGAIDYPVQPYVSRQIAHALNYLSSMHSKQRPKDPFVALKIEPAPDSPAIGTRPSLDSATSPQ